MKLVYPAFIKQDMTDGMYLVYVPDMDTYTQGTDFYDAIEMARDAIGLKALSYEDEELPLPDPSAERDAITIAKAKADADFIFSDGVLTYVDVDTVAYKNRIRNRSVKKNCTIPSWLNEKAEQYGVNFSRVLQDALIEIVGSN